MPISPLVRKTFSPGQWRSDGPRRGGVWRARLRSWMRRGGWKRRALIGAAALFVVGALSMVTLFAVYSRELPDPDKIADRVLAQTTKIYDRTGETVLYEIHGDQRRTVVQLADIPENVKHATIAIEDKNFYKHGGFSLWAIARTLVTNVLRGQTAGGSTITQQFVKNSILTNEKTLTRKIKELVLSYQLERKFSKDEILQLYLNEIPYGSNNYGVQAAASSYFGKDIKDLTLAESAVLAALPQAPTYYSPYGSHVDILLSRQKYILDLMVDQKYITEEEAETAKAEEITFSARRESIIAPHFVFYVRELLTEAYGEDVVEQGGLKVVTTLDVKHQQAAEAAVEKFGARNEERYDASNAALVSMDTKTGQILAMVGSRDYFDVEHDGNVNVTLSPRQPGSSFKPFVYTAAFERGYTPETMVFDLVTNFDTGSGTPYIPHNYDSTEHGPLSLRQALAGSLNIPAVKVLYLAGVNYVLDLAEKFGYTTFGERDRFGLSLVLGGAEVKLLEHVAAYATLAREGLRHPSTPLLRVEDKNGKILQEFKEEEVKVIESTYVRQTNSILSDDGARAYIFGRGSALTLPDRPVAAKSGTTNDYHDAWTIGYTPSLAAGVWVGNNDNSEMKRGADGSIVAAPIWQDYMKSVLAGTPVETFQTPAPNDAEKPVLRGEIDVVHTLPVDRLTQRVIPESCRDTYPASYVEQKQFKETHTILHWVKKDDPRGDVPDHPEDDPQYSAWEGAVRAWATGQHYPDLNALTEERCDLRNPENAPTVTVTAPANGSTETNASHTVAAVVDADRDIVNVVFAIDGVAIQTLSTPPYSFAFTNTQFENGSHTLTATATDSIGAEGIGSASFTYALGDEIAASFFTSPQENAVFSTDDFPITIKAQAFAPSGLASARLSRGGSVLGTLTDPASGLLSFSLGSLPVGTSTLTLTVTTVGGAVLTKTRVLTVQNASS